jgi:hypothetical protein
MKLCSGVSERRRHGDKRKTVVVSAIPRINLGFKAVEFACYVKLKAIWRRKSQISFKKSLKVGFFADARGDCVIYLLLQVLFILPNPQEVATLRHGD